MICVNLNKVVTIGGGQMFQIGDNIVYPMHGAGVIEAIEEKEIHGETHSYYVIKIPENNMKVMIPIDKIPKLRIRSIVDTTTLSDVLCMLSNGVTEAAVPWKQRYQRNLDKLKTGEILDGAEVIRDLVFLNKEKSLNSSEKQLLDNAKKILISELGLIKCIDELAATELLNCTLNGIEFPA